MKYIIGLLILMSSCRIYVQELRDEDFVILNTIIENEKIKILLDINYVKKNPIVYFNIYNKLYDLKDEKFNKDLNGNVKWIFSKNEIDAMKNKYDNWNHIYWDENRLKSDVIFKSNISNISNDNRCKLSYPLYNDKKDKAFVLMHISSGLIDYSEYILLLNKINGSWVQVGKIFYFGK